MKAYLLWILYQAARAFYVRVCTPEFFDAVEQAVVDLLNDDLTGAEKKARVVATIKNQWDRVDDKILDDIIQIVLRNALGVPAYAPTKRVSIMTNVDPQ